MKNTLIAAACAAGIAFSTSAFAEEKQFTPAEAEQEIMNNCIENPDNSREQCVCVLGGLKEGLPEKDYDFMINLITHAMNGNFGAMWDYAVKNDITLSELKRFSETVEAVADRVDEECDNPGIDLDMNL